MPCPFGFSGPNPHHHEETDDDSPNDEQNSPQKRSAQVKGADRFDINKDPVSWFYQNQIRSEEEFKKKKQALQAEARLRLDQIMEKKGKNIAWDIDSDDDMSIHSSELSEIDSDVASITSIQSTADRWVEDSGFQEPATVTLRLLSALTFVVSSYYVWRGVQSVVIVRSYWGILSQGWVPVASVVSPLASCALTGYAVVTLLHKSRREVCTFQCLLHVQYATALLLLCACYVFPAHVDEEIRGSACSIQLGSQDQGSRLCEYIPEIDQAVSTSLWHVMIGNITAAAVSFATMLAVSWFQYELSFVEKKAIKFRRREKRRKHTIPWDKIKVVGPVTTCGGAALRAKTQPVSKPKASHKVMTQGFFSFLGFTKHSVGASSDTAGAHDTIVNGVDMKKNQ